MATIVYKGATTSLSTGANHNSDFSSTARNDWSIITTNSTGVTVGTTIATKTTPASWNVSNYVSSGLVLQGFDVTVPLTAANGYYNVKAIRLFPAAGDGVVGGTEIYGTVTIEVQVDPATVYGCTDSEATNYNPLATVDDGSCVYNPVGCTDPTAGNYNSHATIDDGSCTYTPGCAPNDADLQIVFDALHRPAVVDRAGGLRFRTSRNAGHSFDSYPVRAATSKSPSLWFDRRTNRPHIVFSSGTTLYSGVATSDGEPSGNWTTFPAITGLSGAFPLCAPHPTDAGRVLMAYLDGGSLKTAISYDSGDPATWQTLGTIDTGLTFTCSGRAGLCWLGAVPFVLYRSGNNLVARQSADGGNTWGSGVNVSTGGPHHGISLAGHDGRLIAAAQDASALHLWASGDLGATWAAITAPSSPVYPASVAIDPLSGRLWFGATKVSDNSSTTWIDP